VTCEPRRAANACRAYGWNACCRSVPNVTLISRSSSLSVMDGVLHTMTGMDHTLSFACCEGGPLGLCRSSTPCSFCLGVVVSERQLCG
jgi:hypothetical protein